MLDDFATKLIENEHYAQDDVALRRDQVSTFKCIGYIFVTKHLIRSLLKLVFI